MPVFRWKKPKDTDDPVILKNELLDDMRYDMKQAQYNNNWKRAASIEKRIKEIEESK